MRIRLVNDCYRCYNELYLCLFIRMDEDWKRRHEIYGFMPADRPKKWREKAINVLHDAVENKYV